MREKYVLCMEMLCETTATRRTHFSVGAFLPPESRRHGATETYFICPKIQANNRRMYIALKRPEARNYLVHSGHVREIKITRTKT